MGVSTKGHSKWLQSIIIIKKKMPSHEVRGYPPGFGAAGSWGGDT